MNSPIIINRKRVGDLPALLRLMRIPSPRTIFRGFDPQAKKMLIWSQILWWGFGVTLCYDITESLLGWPHYQAIMLYSALMIMGSWLGPMSILLVGLFTLPSLIATLYFSCLGALPGESVIALWTQLLVEHTFDYLGWFLMVMGSFINGIDNQRLTHRGASIGCLILGALFMLTAAVYNSLAGNFSEKMFLLVEQGSYFLWIIGLTNQQPKSKCTLFKNKMLQRLLILLIGVIAMLIYDWFYQNITGFTRYGIVFIPPLFILWLGRYVAIDSES